MEIVGILVKKTDDRMGESSNGTWRRAQFLLEVPGMHPRRIAFSVSDGASGRIAHFESFVGKNVTISFDIDAREWQGKWFNDITAWGVLEYVSKATQGVENSFADATNTDGDPLPI